MTTGNPYPCDRRLEPTLEIPAILAGMDGIFNINKAAGMTSHDVTARVRRLTTYATSPYNPTTANPSPMMPSALIVLRTPKNTEARIR